MLNILIIVIETIGTVAFAVSGVLTAIERRLDVFGAVVLAGVTAVGGGIIRDLILGNTPPVAFQNPYYLLVAFLAAGVMLVVAWTRGNYVEDSRFIDYMPLFQICDAMGLGIFSVLGANTAIACGHGNNLFLTVFVGVLTGVGGGMLRDILVCRTPVVLRRDIYALCSVAGTLLFYGLYRLLPNTAAMLISAGFICLFRLLTAYKKITLPLVSTLTPPDKGEPAQKKDTETSGAK